MLRIFFIFASLLWVACSVDLPAPLAPSGKRTSESLVAVAGDSLYCRDAAFWRAYCDRWGEDLAHGGCEAIATCAEGDTAGVAAIVSDTAWVPFNPSDHGWLRVPQRFPSTRLQRWTHPHYANWGEAGQYDAPAPPDSIGLVTYPFRTQRGKRILYGFPSEPYRASFIETISAQPEQPEPPQPQEPEGVPPEELPVRVRPHNLSLGGPWWIQFGGEEGPPEGISVRSLPSWLSFDEATGRIEGTPPQAGTYEFFVDFGDRKTERHLLIVADEVPNRSLETLIVGQNFSISYGAFKAGAGVSFTIEGDLPPGLSFDLENPDGVWIHGVPEATGTFDFDLVSTDASGEEVYRQEYRYVVILDPEEPLEDEEMMLEDVHVTVVDNLSDQRYSEGTSINPVYFPQGFGGVPPYVYSLSGVPPGLTFDPATRTLSGTPTAAGTYTITYQITDASGGSIAVPMSVVVEPALGIMFEEGFLSDQVYSEGTSINPVYFPQGFGGVPPYVYSLSGVPPGLTFDPATRTLSGTPTAAGTYTITYQITDASGGSIAVPMSVVVEPAEEPDLILKASLGVPFTHLLWQPAIDGIVHSIVGALPAGMSFDEERIAITGTPTQAGSTDFVHLLTYEDGREIRGRLRIVVQ